jgi:hypothetical protein
MAYRKGKRRLSNGRNRPPWSRGQSLAWTAVASLVVLGYQAGMTWLALRSDLDGVSQILVGVCGALLAIGAAWWLGSLHPASLLVLVGATTVGVVGPMCVADEVLAAEGRTIEAAVSGVQVSQSKNDVVYTVRFAGVERAMIVYHPRTPIHEHDRMRVVADPRGRVPTEKPELVDRVWPLPVAIGGALLLVGGLALSATRRRHDAA